MNNHRFCSSRQRVCHCGQSILEDKGATRIRHIVSCFIRGHVYEYVSTRNDHDEYMCIRCGHPLLFAQQDDLSNFKNRELFRKKVRYRCNLFGHKVHPVTFRESLFEYACFCGHSFVKRAGELRKITHPLLCLVAGHSVQEIAKRAHRSEFACRNCGHTFLVHEPHGWLE